MNKKIVAAAYIENYTREPTCVTLKLKFTGQAARMEGSPRESFKGTLEIALPRGVFTNHPLDQEYVITIEKKEVEEKVKTPGPYDIGND